MIKHCTFGMGGVACVTSKFFLASTQIRRRNGVLEKIVFVLWWLIRCCLSYSFFFPNQIDRFFFPPFGFYFLSLWGGRVEVEYGLVTESS